MNLRTTLRRPRTWLIGVPALALVGVVAGPWAYVNLIADDPPERLTFSSAATSASSSASQATTGDVAVTSTAAATSASSTAADADADAGALTGAWQIASGSEAGYRVGEVLFGQSIEAVGRTSDVTGDLQISGSTITSGSFSVDLTTVTSDSDRRDNQFNGRIMDTATYPTATFALTQPIVLEDVPADLEEVTVSATGELTLHGVTNTVTVDLVARRNGDAFEVNGSVPVAFADYQIPDASFGGVAEVEDQGEIEFLLVFQPGT